MRISFPALAPGVHVYSRDDENVQIGIDPATAIVADARAIKILLPVLTGAFSISEVLAHAKAQNLHEHSVMNFLELMQSLTLLINVEPELSSRARNTANDYQRHNLLRETKSNSKLIERRSLTEIEIRGAGRLGTTISLLLAGSGFPNVRIIDSAPTAISDLTPWGASRMDIGSRRDLTAMQIIERVTKGFTSHNNYLRFKSDNKIVLLVPDQNSDFPWLNPLLTDSLMAESIPHLFAASATNESHISPVIIPGKIPCVRCRYYWLTDIDSAWPLISNQLSKSPAQDLSSLDQILRTATVAVNRVIDWIESPGEIISDIARVSRNGIQLNSEETEFHPKCGCAWDSDIFD